LALYCGEVVPQYAKVKERHIVNSVAEMVLLLQVTKEEQFLKGYFLVWKTPLRCLQIQKLQQTFTMES